jgi:hypothetical protein
MALIRQHFKFETGYRVKSSSSEIDSHSRNSLTFTELEGSLQYKRLHGGSYSDYGLLCLWTMKMNVASILKKLVSTYMNIQCYKQPKFHYHL